MTRSERVVIELLRLMLYLLFVLATNTPVWRYEEARQKHEFWVVFVLLVLLNWSFYRFLGHLANRLGDRFDSTEDR